MTEDEFKALADKIAAHEATPEEKQLFIAELRTALKEARASLVQ